MEYSLKVSDLEKYSIEKNKFVTIINTDIYDNTWFYFYGNIYSYDLEGFIYCKYKSWAVVGRWDFNNSAPVWNKTFNPIL